MAVSEKSQLEKPILNNYCSFVEQIIGQMFGNTCWKLFCLRNCMTSVFQLAKKYVCDQSSLVGRMSAVKR